MNREELLTYLMEKRQLVAPVAVAQENLYTKKAELVAAKKRMNSYAKLSFGLSILFGLIGMGGSSSGLLGHLCFWGIFVLLGIKHFVIVPAKQQEINEAQSIYNTEANNPDYINGAKGFPNKFYNYTDIYRLYSLIEEHRADDLKEAFNLLENQQYQETKVSIQEEIRALQADTANSARISAIANTVTAFNTRK